ncbi:TIM barrel protein [Cetobacterium somerae]|uniref:sugar phosphate isomerase/epimerase family protein n=1 Tax=Cetobacterium somerae TaxID=188913 RepID=UPI00225844CB|nr:TIM barrel protein [Cetobacterium somerae]MCX3067030.1 TIM barrel protein [Cetobacterium somerae]
MKISGFIDEIDIGFEKEVEVIKKLGMKYIELRSVNGTNISDLSIEKVNDIKKYLQNKNIKISCIASPIGKINIDEIDFENKFEEHLKKFKHVLDISQILKVKYVRVFSFFLKKEQKEKYKDLILEKMKSFIKEISELDIILLHENEKGIYGDDIESSLKLIEEIDSEKFRLIFDPANFIQVGISPLKAYEKLKKFVEYVHLKDANFSSQENVLIGTGDGEILELLKELKKEKYEGFLSLEPHLINFSVLQSLEQEDVNERKVQFKDGKEAFKKSLETLLKMIEKI